MIDIVEIQKILPHRYPFLLIDRVIDIVPNESIVAIKNVTIGEQIFQGHFPSHPIYPGVMIIEGMAQAGGVLAFKSMPNEDLSNKVVYFMSIDKAKFRRPIKPGDTIVYKLSALKHRGKIWILKGEAFVDDILVAEAELQAMIMDK
ncbi:MAG: 3-hydroxyacyl-ACP dehydratase FabZ [Campylobacter sputorum]|uniref:3-hydroxyacyl-ACP dehydratase FabZ n=1 Tax=Campylobacter sputorum TaxID=206 RepID=UPI000B77A07D|nr:3-hydroxyacyl-ACP dehydratase FabZ [Campylobacter sputorum]ASM38002.1 3-hydroxyacyl-[acp] dehydratase [Campylobacter sputorum bv. paraureolyticus LMG 11764]MDY6119809.1 3-hydroxyacyl-ACP dehydratase FabZ [Campylobacter sputorum]